MIEDDDIILYCDNSSTDDMVLWGGNMMRG